MLDPLGVAVGYSIAKMQTSAELADLSASIDAKWTALKRELAAAEAELEELKVLHADKARKQELIKAAAAQRDPGYSVEVGVGLELAALRDEPSQRELASPSKSLAPSNKS